jgi:hypothetical protein
MDTTNLMETKEKLVLQILEETNPDVIHFLVDCFKEIKQTLDNPFEKIPGLPYTEEEQQACMLRAVDDYKNGRTISHEDLVKEMKSW